MECIQRSLASRSQLSQLSHLVDHFLGAQQRWPSCLAPCRMSAPWQMPHKTRGCMGRPQHSRLCKASRVGLLACWPTSAQDCCHLLTAHTPHTCRSAIARWPCCWLQRRCHSSRRRRGPLLQGHQPRAPELGRGLTNCILQGSHRLQGAGEASFCRGASFLLSFPLRPHGLEEGSEC